MRFFGHASYFIILLNTGIHTHTMRTGGQRNIHKKNNYTWGGRGHWNGLRGHRNLGQGRWPAATSFMTTRLRVRSLQHSPAHRCWFPKESSPKASKGYRTRSVCSSSTLKSTDIPGGDVAWSCEWGKEEDNEYIQSVMTQGQGWDVYIPHYFSLSNVIPITRSFVRCKLSSCG